jgi:hypothetical protein
MWTSNTHFGSITSITSVVVVTIWFLFARRSLIYRVAWQCPVGQGLITWLLSFLQSIYIRPHVKNPQLRCWHRDVYHFTGSRQLIQDQRSGHSKQSCSVSDNGRSYNMLREHAAAPWFVVLDKPIKNITKRTAAYAALLLIAMLPRHQALSVFPLSRKSQMIKYFGLPSSQNSTAAFHRQQTDTKRSEKT